MRVTWMLGITLAITLAAGCGGSDQTNNSGSSNTGANGGSAAEGGAGGGNAGGNNAGGGNAGGGNAGGGNVGGGNTGGSNTGGGNTGGSNTGGGNTGGSNTGGSTGADMCTPLTEDFSKNGAACGGNVGCATGYTCHEFHGITVTESCIILCEQDCECPMGTVCIPRSDKTSSWKECAKSS